MSFFFFYSRGHNQVSESGQRQRRRAGRQPDGRAQEAGATQLLPQRQEALRGRPDGPEGETVPVQPEPGDERGEPADAVAAVRALHQYM